MDQTEEERRTTDISVVQPFLGTNDRQTGDGKKYPKGISKNEDPSDDKSGNDGTGVNELPVSRTILDDDIPIGEGANDERFSDTVDMSPKQELDPVGPHNMQRGGIFDNVVRKIRTRNINKI